MRTRQSRWLSAIQLVLLVVGLIALRPGIAVAQVGNSLEGVLTIIWGDPRPGSLGGEVRYTLNLADGTRVRLQLAPGQRSIAEQNFNKRIRVTGRPLEAAADGDSRLAVDSLEAAEAPQDVQPPEATTIRRVLFIPLKFKSSSPAKPGDGQTPHVASWFLTLTNPKTPNLPQKIPATINGFFDKTSWSKLQWQAHYVSVNGLNTAGGWLTLPKTKEQYAPCGWTSACANLNQIAADAIALAQGEGVNISVYDNLNFVLNNDLDCCAWGGSFFSGKLFGATWEPPWGQETGTYVHEFGHSIGLPHSGWTYFAYDSKWDQMSRGSSAQAITCGTYKSRNDSNQQTNITCTEPGSGYLGSYKEVLGWLPAGNIHTINAKTLAAGTQITLTPAGSTLSGKKMIKICIFNAPCTGGAARFFTVEARLKAFPYDKGIPGDGVVIHDFKRNRAAIGGSCYFNSQSGWAVMVDATTGDYNKTACTGTGLDNGQFTVGKTYTNVSLGISVKVVSKTGNNFVVLVKRTK